MDRPTFIASCSFGKDSIATILLALEHNEPLDKVVFSEVMFDIKNNISGEYPEHIKWIYNEAIPRLQQMGVLVDVVRSEFDYLYYFHKKIRNKLSGFPIGGKCIINDRCKIRPIKKYKKQYANHIDYIGIAIDEPTRLSRLKDNQISLLAKYNYTEKMAYDLAKKHNLLSPLYATETRGGCWFCPNQTCNKLALLRRNHPNLWEKLRNLKDTPNLISYGFKYGETIEQIEKKINYIDRQEELQLKLFEL